MVLGRYVRALCGNCLNGNRLGLTVDPQVCGGSLMTIAVLGSGLDLHLDQSVFSAAWGKSYCASLFNITSINFGLPRVCGRSVIY